MSRLGTSSGGARATLPEKMLEQKYAAELAEYRGIPTILKQDQVELVKEALQLMKVELNSS